MIIKKGIYIGPERSMYGERCIAISILEGFVMYISEKSRTLTPYPNTYYSDKDPYFKYLSTGTQSDER